MEQFDKLYKIILDSGATSHMVPFKSILFNYKRRSGKVRLGDASKVIDIEGHGDTILFDDVHYVPNLTYGLISVGKLDDQGFRTIFDKQTVTVYAPNGRKLLSGSK